jgi:alpha-glucosidase
MNKAMQGQGGNTLTSYAPAAQYITNKQRGFIFDQTSIGIAAFDDPMTTEMLYWHQDTISGTLLYGEDFMALSQELSKTVGTMRPLPEWALKGAVVGIVGGQDFVNEKYAMMKKLELPLVGIWMQDWVGEHTYAEGTRLIWNWQLKKDWYYDWDNMVTNWAADGVKPFIYINPYI